MDATTSATGVLSRQAVDRLSDSIEQVLRQVAGEKGLTLSEIERRQDGAAKVVRLTWRPTSKRTDPDVMARSIAVTVDPDHGTTQIEVNAWIRVQHWEHREIETLATPPDVDQLRQAVEGAHKVVAGWSRADLTRSTPVPDLMGQL